MKAILSTILLCWSFLDKCPEPQRFACLDRPQQCYELGADALRTGQDPAVLLAVACHEAKFCSDAIGRAGERSTLQVLPKNCPGCSDLEFRNRGVEMLDRLTTRHGLFEGLCHYHDGTTCKDRTYPAKILALIRSTAIAFR